MLLVLVVSAGFGRSVDEKKNARPMNSRARFWTPVRQRIIQARYAEDLGMDLHAMPVVVSMSTIVVLPFSFIPCVL
jgi:hypothetical protein